MKGLQSAYTKLLDEKPSGKGTNGPSATSQADNTTLKVTLPFQTSNGPVNMHQDCFWRICCTDSWDSAVGLASSSVVLLPTAAG